MADKLFGASIKRREDPRLITGKGTYVDDVKLPNTTYAAFVRSPHAHAKIGKIDTAAARKLKGVVAIYTGADLIAGAQAGTGDVTLWLTTQNPHVHRLIMSAFVLGMPEHKLRVISPDVGGGFGSKIFIYPEECVAVFATRLLGRPVKWTADRREA